MYSSYNDNSANHKAIAKFILPYIIGFLLLALIGQIVGQLFPVNQLKNVSGRVTKLKTIISYISTRRNGNKPSYALVITIDNAASYYLEDSDSERNKVTGQLQVGDSLTIYYPNLLFTVLNLGFVHPISQLNVGEKVIYSFESQKKSNWVIMAFLTALLLIVISLRLSWLKGDW